ncbi:PREDICTED: uncharacterized protein LOC106819697 [Priapulus caudatus]|uniref:Uncharacterized protein LOC106819697 n=1 Tax=Priapulus caudatus TaxID=37621 RepID=A0ABM1F5R1_PRICU|nr:PREDICTED: uncharacterized protein LOC106819697 [Priapulus caudatus]
MLARFGLMHLLATNLCVWVRTIAYEAVETSVTNTTWDHASPIINAYFKEQSWNYTIEQTASQQNNEWTDDCNVTSSILELERQIAPYLYPLTIEYCLISAGIMYMIWSNISKMELAGTHIGASVYLARRRRHAHETRSPRPDPATTATATTTRASSSGIFRGSALEGLHVKIRDYAYKGDQHIEVPTCKNPRLCYKGDQHLEGLSVRPLDDAYEEHQH